MSIPAGWYPDPQNPAAQRYWDGAAWTQHAAGRPRGTPGRAGRRRSRVRAAGPGAGLGEGALVPVRGVGASRLLAVDQLPRSRDAGGVLVVLPVLVPRRHRAVRDRHRRDRLLRRERRQDDSHPTERWLQHHDDRPPPDVGGHHRPGDRRDSGVPGAARALLPAAGADRAATARQRQVRLVVPARVRAVRRTRRPGLHAAAGDPPARTGTAHPSPDGAGRRLQGDAEQRVDRVADEPGRGGVVGAVEPPRSRTARPSGRPRPARAGASRSSARCRADAASTRSAAGPAGRATASRQRGQPAPPPRRARRRSTPSRCGSGARAGRAGSPSGRRPARAQPRDEDQVALGLRHLLAVEADHARRARTCGRTATRRSATCASDGAHLVVREHQVAAAALDVEAHAEVVAARSRCTRCASPAGRARAALSHDGSPGRAACHSRQSSGSFLPGRSGSPPRSANSREHLRRGRGRDTEPKRGVGCDREVEVAVDVVRRARARAAARRSSTTSGIDSTAPT